MKPTRSTRALLLAVLVAGGAAFCVAPGGRVLLAKVVERLGIRSSRRPLYRQAPADAVGLGAAAGRLNGASMEMTVFRTRLSGSDLIQWYRARCRGEYLGRTTIGNGLSAGLFKEDGHTVTVLGVSEPVSGRTTGFLCRTRGEPPIGRGESTDVTGGDDPVLPRPVGGVRTMALDLVTAHTYARTYRTEAHADAVTLFYRDWLAGQGWRLVDLPDRVQGSVTMLAERPPETAAVTVTEDRSAGVTWVHLQRQGASQEAALVPAQGASE